MEKEIPNNWELANIGDVYSFIGGGTPSKSNQSYWGGQIPWASIKDISKVDVLVKTMDMITKEGLENSSANLAQIGDVIIGTRMTVGKPVITEVQTAINQDLKVVKSELASKFTYYWFKLLSPVFESLSSGTTVKGIRVDVMKDVKFPLPPLAEQKRIVAKLDTLFASLENTKTRLAKIPTLLKNFKQAVLTQAVTGKLTEQWREGKELESGLKDITNNRKENYLQKVKLAKELGERKPKKLDETDFELNSYEEDIEYPKKWELGNLKNIADFITDGEHATPLRTDDGFYLLSARNVQNGFISLAKVDYVPEEEYLRLKKRCNPEPKDVLISCSGTVGRVSIVPKGLDFVMVRSAALVKLQWNNKSSKYIEFALRSRLVQDQMLKLQKSTAQANLFIGPIGKIVIPIPPILEQTEIVRRVESLFAKADAIEAQYSKLKQKIDTLPQALLAKAFRGELARAKPIG